MLMSSKKATFIPQASLWVFVANFITSARPELQESNNTQAEVNAQSADESAILSLGKATGNEDNIKKLDNAGANIINWVTGN